MKGERLVEKYEDTINLRVFLAFHNFHPSSSTKHASTDMAKSSQTEAWYLYFFE